MHPLQLTKGSLDVPTLGETVSGFWARHRFDGGLEGAVGMFRAPGGLVSCAWSSPKPRVAEWLLDTARLLPLHQRIGGSSLLGGRTCLCYRRTCRASQDMQSVSGDTPGAARRASQDRGQALDGSRETMLNPAKRLLAIPCPHLKPELDSAFQIPDPYTPKPFRLVTSFDNKLLRLIPH